MSSSSEHHEAGSEGGGEGELQTFAPQDLPGHSLCSHSHHSRLEGQAKETRC